MNTKKIIPILLMFPLLASCGSKELVIPTVDVESIVPVLPTRPTYEYKQEDIKTDGTKDYIDIYELSDFHGAVNEETHSSGNYIGLSKLASYLDIKRQSNKGGTVVVSSGDMFQGSADSNLTRGYMVNYAMNYMGFDSMAIGNHEFDWTDSWIKKNSELSYNDHKIPFISANIVKKGTTEVPDFITKSTIVNRGDYKIGIIGSIGKELKSSILKSCVDSYDFLDEEQCVNEEALRLKEVEKCDIVILTAHDGLEDKGALKSMAFKNVDAVFGGHAHKNVSKLLIGDIPAVQTANYGKSVGHIQLSIDKATKEVTCETYGIDINPTGLAGLQENEDVKKIMSNYSAKLDDISNIKLGKASDKLEISGALKNVCVKSMYDSAIKANTELGLGIPEQNIIASFHNINGGIRKDIEQGNITYRDVYASFPFDNEIVLYKVQGRVLRQKRESFSNLAVCRTFESFDSIEYNTDYYLVLTDFIAFDEDFLYRIFNFTEEDLIRTGKVVRDEVANYIYQKGTIKAADHMSGKVPFKGLD